MTANELKDDENGPTSTGAYGLSLGWGSDYLLFDPMGLLVSPGFEVSQSGEYAIDETDTLFQMDGTLINAGVRIGFTPLSLKQHSGFFEIGIGAGYDYQWKAPDVLDGTKIDSSYSSLHVLNLDIGMSYRRSKLGNLFLNLSIPFSVAGKNHEVSEMWKVEFRFQPRTTGKSTRINQTYTGRNKAKVSSILKSSNTSSKSRNDRASRTARPRTRPDRDQQLRKPKTRPSTTPTDLPEEQISSPQELAETIEKIDEVEEVQESEVQANEPSLVSKEISEDVSVPPNLEEAGLSSVKKNESEADSQIAVEVDAVDTPPEPPTPVFNRPNPPEVFTSDSLRVMYVTPDGSQNLDYQKQFPELPVHMTGNSSSQATPPIYTYLIDESSNQQTLMEVVETEIVSSYGRDDSTAWGMTQSGTNGFTYYVPHKGYRLVFGGIGGSVNHPISKDADLAGKTAYANFEYGIWDNLSLSFGRDHDSLLTLTDTVRYLYQRQINQNAIVFQLNYIFLDEAEYRSSISLRYSKMFFTRNFSYYENEDGVNFFNAIIKPGGEGQKALTFILGADYVPQPRWLVSGKLSYKHQLDEVFTESFSIPIPTGGSKDTTINIPTHLGHTFTTQIQMARTFKPRKMRFSFGSVKRVYAPSVALGLMYFNRSEEEIDGIASDGSGGSFFSIEPKIGVRLGGAANTTMFIGAQFPISSDNHATFNGITAGMQGHIVSRKK